MSNRSGTHYSAPTDADRRPVMLGVSNIDGETPLPLEINSSGQLLVDATLSVESIEIGKVDQGNPGVSPWPVSVSNFPASQAVTGTFWQTTQPVSGTVGASQTGNWLVGTETAVINVGQQVSNTTAVQLSSVSTIPTNGIIVQAISTNLASVFIGGVGVTPTTGFELQAGQATPFTANLNTIYVVGSNSTDAVCWTVD